MLPAREQLKHIKQGVEHLINEEELIRKLEKGRPLKIKWGVDPTRPDLTFGHLVVFNKMRHFQELGHECILLIGDYTTTVGDPSGRSTTRPMLTRQEIDENAKTYLNQAFKVLDKNKTVVRYNSEWFDKKNFSDALILARKMTVAQMLERDDFSKRFAAQTPISIVEFMYSLLQGQDSVELEADVELGGNDQLFNLLVGRDLQKMVGQEEQIVLTMPLLVGLDGVQKMSKSLNNYIAFNDSSKNMFGKIMSISDETMWTYYTLLLEKTQEEIKDLKAQHPMHVKKQLAYTLVGRFHSKEAAEHELDQFEKVFSQGQIPEDMPNFTWKAVSEGLPEANIVDILGCTNLFPSKKEIRRLIEQSAVKINNEVCLDAKLTLHKPEKPLIIQAGKRIFCKITE